MTTAYGVHTLRAKSMVSRTAMRSNTPGQPGTMTNVEASITAVTEADMFGGVSMNTHSMPSSSAVLRYRRCRASRS
jgi:hypothetical protein